MTLNQTVFIRKLTAHDFDDALQLYDELVGAKPAVRGDDRRDRFQRVLSFEGTHIFGAEVDGTVIGMATLHVLPNMTYNGSPYCLVENVATLKAYQSHGIGRAVMHHVIQAAWDAGTYKIMLLTGQKRNSSGFYRRIGFDQDEKYGMVLRRDLT
ncbi:GNAT family N-acetyltransferase [Parasulfitobacter algicola]|uniref:GNAT family N-acetyltransferase n=1 Tax=Parasulfitobacter algicola TaxID=2614809 RepID=A0ABX2ISX3_9RHOB|nr:GNAT family N-acetyltransferase [Sulfitobacter algicola]NSX56013.1 GNAT family N-acetyltransferase [Sulfitobacter algicola]